MSPFAFYIWEFSWRNAFLSCVCIELSFYAYYRCHLHPRAQIFAQSCPPYRDYPCPAEDRAKLLQRICHRLERQAVQEPHHDFRKRFSDFMLAWFRPTGTNVNVPPGLRAASFNSSISSAEVSSDEESYEEDCIRKSKRWSIAGLKKAEADDFFAWAFFGKDTKNLDPPEQLGLQKIYTELARDYGLTFEPGRGGLLEGRRLTLDPIRSVHRPLLAYAIIHGLERIGNVVLRIQGFERHIAKTGLVYWHRNGSEPEKRLPLLFFHGIAPAGKTFYLPLCLLGLGDRQRNMYLFENRGISSSYLTFDVLSDDDTVSGVEEALHVHGDHARPISLCGHSFGSCPLTWLLHSSLRDNIQQFILIDPVSILLSEPDVMVNFLYARLDASSKAVNSHLAGIRLVGSELFTEYYLRRNFAWYNSELWLEDIPKSIRILVCLSEKDQILSAPNVKREVESLDLKEIDLVYWEGVDHADCITNPRTWPQLRELMLAQESSLLKKD